ncbi:UNVERIFIED_CONTAM: spermatogenesis-associated protein 17 [Siphonaria sp. JEL0065]|nr:spermatogenesis-associated protein 17 [Siphonaria sp. JEL0065]
MATRIQKIWKGYWSRKAKFDYAARKQYLADIVVKMEDMRLKVEAHAKQQQLESIAAQAQFEKNLLAKLAGQRHHLVGTKAIPGVMAKAKSPSLSKKIEYCNDKAQVMLKEDRILRLPPLSKLPEKQLKESDDLKNWIRDTVGTNYKNVRVKPEIVFEFEEDKKRAQGPFLPLSSLEAKKSKPLRPTLRVDTDFYDTSNYWREQRLKEANTRISNTFVNTKHVQHEQSGYFLGGGPYTLRATPKKKTKTNNLQKPKLFKNVLAPVPLFDDMLDFS